MVMRSIASRMALWVLAGSALVLAVIGALLLSLTRAQILEHADREAAALAANAGNQIQTRIDRVAVSTKMLASMIATRQDMAEQLLRDTLKANQDMAGLAAAIRPAAARLDPSLHSPFVRREGNGELVSRDLLQDKGSYGEKTWFLGGLGCSTGCWQRTFFSQSRQQRLINYSVAFSHGGAPAGIINADVTLDWLHQILADLDKPEGAYVFVLDNEGNYLAHDNPDPAGQACQRFHPGAAGQQPSRNRSACRWPRTRRRTAPCGSTRNRSTAPTGGWGWWCPKCGSTPGCRRIFTHQPGAWPAGPAWAWR